MGVAPPSHEGWTSAVAHLCLISAVGYQIIRDPWRVGASAVLSFGISTLLNTLLKHTVKRGAMLLGHDGPTAFWRRPAGSGRDPDSPAFPSAHTATGSAVMVFIASETGYPLLTAAPVTLLMAFGRLADANHTVLQTCAGIVWGPVLGLLSAQVVTRYGLCGPDPPPWWGGLATFLLIVGPSLHVTKSWRDSWGKMLPGHS